MARSIFAAALLAALGTSASALNITITPPTQDRYLYPFAFTGGTGPTANVFSTTVPNFDARDATFVIRFDTDAAGIPTALTPGNYGFDNVRLVLWHTNASSFAWDTRTGVDDQIQVFGMGVSAAATGGLTKANWNENSGYQGQAGAPGGAERNPHPLNIDAAAPVQNVTNDLAATPWGLGEPVYGTGAGEYTPGATPTAPFPVTFELNIANSRVREYIREGFAAGFVDFVVSTDIVSGGPGGTPPIPYPQFYTKEEADASGDYAPTLQIVNFTTASSVTNWMMYQ